MIKLKSLIRESNEYDFVGFHRQRRERSEYDDQFITGNNYGESHFRGILDALYNNDRMEASEKGWIDYSWDKYEDNYEEMEEEVAGWLNEKGYRWIFVTETRPHDIDSYGDFIYKIYFKPSSIIDIIDDPMGASDIAYAYMYHVKNPPMTKEYSDD
jgi:hypothetical protein